MPQIRVLGFASAKEALGRPSLDWTIPEEGVALPALLEALAEEFPRLRTVLPMARIVRNGEYVRGDRVRVRPGDEIAIHPPYSGG